MPGKAASSAPPPFKAPEGGPPRTYLEQTRDLLNSLLLVLPLLFVYEVGLLFTGGKTLNGVDFITIALDRQWGLQGILVFNAILLVAGGVGAIYLWKERNFTWKVVVGVLAESTVYALLLGTVILLIMDHLPLVSGAGLQTGPEALGIGSRILLSLGAGVNEELVFRLGLYTTLAWACGKFTTKGPAVTLAVVISSVLFSLAHYAGPEQFQVFTFVYRALAGALFCLLFHARGFAIAVYTHAIYDIYVLVFSS
jgi:membrane protease YdiL (CAAX protease family)